MLVLRDLFTALQSGPLCQDPGQGPVLSLRGFCIFGSAELLFSPSHDPLSAWAEHTIHPPTQILLYGLLCLEL